MTMYTQYLNILLLIQPHSHPTDPQPVKHIPVWYLTVHMLLAMSHLSVWKRVDIDRLCFSSQPCFESFTGHRLLKPHLNPSQTDLSFSLFILSWLLPYFPPNFLSPLPNSGLIVSCLHQWNPEKEGGDLRDFIIWFSNLLWVGLHKGTLTPPTKALPIHTHMPSPFLFPLSPYMHV